MKRTYDRFLSLLTATKYLHTVLIGTANLISEKNGLTMFKILLTFAV